MRRIEEYRTLPNQIGTYHQGGHCSKHISRPDTKQLGWGRPFHTAPREMGEVVSTVRPSIVNAPTNPTVGLSSATRTISSIQVGYSQSSANTNLQYFDS